MTEDSAIGLSWGTLIGLVIAALIVWILFQFGEKIVDLIISFIQK